MSEWRIGRAADFPYTRTALYRWSLYLKRSWLTRFLLSWVIDALADQHEDFERLNDWCSELEERIVSLEDEIRYLQRENNN